MRHFWKSAGLLTVVLAACTIKAAEPPPKYPDSNSYCNGRAQAECNDTVIAACAAPTKDKCVGARQSVCNAAVPAGKSYDFTKAEECINKVSDAYKDAKVTQDEIKTYTEACTPLFSGTGVKDSSCSADDDCKLSDGLRCALSAAGAQPEGGALTLSGTCQIPKIVAGGDSCAPVDAVCTPGYHCGATKHCDINGDTGEACSDGLPCKQTLKCSASGMCLAKLLDGSPCVIDDDCANDICLPQSNICVSQITFAPNEPFCVSAR